ncbi:MAG: hypothetical protein ACTS2F_15685 [Thainema sp.]
MQDSLNRPPQRPAVVIWLKVYCGVLAAIYLLIALLSLVFFSVNPAELEMTAEEATIIGTIFLLIGGALFIVFLIPIFLRPRPWLWIYDIVVICLGFTSFCILPFSVALLIFWLKPEVKRYFGMTT